MTNRKIIFIDECGYTGDNLIDKEQPFFVLASIGLTEEVCKEYKNEFFSKVKSAELKHSQLCRRNSHQKRIIEFIRKLREDADETAFSVIYKDYCIIAKMVDYIVNNVLIDGDIDIYEGGANLAMSNLIFYLLKLKTSEDYFRSLLTSFQDFIQKRTVDSFHLFYSHFDHNFGEELEHFFTFFRYAKIKYGTEILDYIPADSLEIALTSAFVIMNKWKTRYENEFHLIHDASSNMLKQKTFWDKLVSPNFQKTAIGYDRRVMNFPVAVGITSFEESKRFAGLQLCDILAGAMTRCYNWILADKPHDDLYAKLLVELFQDNFWVHNIIPEGKFTPEELGCDIISKAKPIEHLGEILSNYK